jgi:hypothetical protein
LADKVVELRSQALTEPGFAVALPLHGHR